MPKFCPQCTNVQLKIADRKGVEIDYCPDCGGIWLDKGEIEAIQKENWFVTILNLFT